MNLNNLSEEEVLEIEQQISEIKEEIDFSLSNSISYNILFQKVLLDLIKQSQRGVKKQIAKKILLIILNNLILVSVIITILAFNAFNVGIMFFFIIVLLLIINSIRLFNQVTYLNSFNIEMMLLIDLMHSPESRKFTEEKFRTALSTAVSEWYDLLYVSFIVHNDEINKENAPSYFLLYLDKLGKVKYGYNYIIPKQDGSFN